MSTAPDPAPRRATPPAPFEITTSEHDEWSVVTPAGDIDIATADRVRAALAAQAGKVALDLREVTFLDSSGLRVIIQEERRAHEEQREFAIVPGSASVRRLLEIAGVADRLRVLELGD